MNDSRGMKFKGSGSYSTGIRTYRVAVVVLTVLSFLFVLSAAVVQAQDVAQKAPLNPKYVDYMAKKQAGAPVVTALPEGHQTGLMPSPIDFSHMRDHAALSQQMEAGTTSYPSSFDLRKKKKVSPVKDQANCGSCWAFGAIASVESALMPNVKADFSEQFLMDSAGFSWGPCEGGYELMAIAVMARHGVVAEHLYPYQYLWPQAQTPTTASSAWAGAHISYVPLIAAGLDSKGTPITTYVKKYVYGGAAVAIGFRVDEHSPYLVTAANGDVCYYTDGTDTKGDGHEVVVVGWNDNYPASNFGITPPGNGAWLIKNSWGAYWGNSGYFWMSYYDESVSPDAYTYNVVESASKYNWTYQYDPLGWTSNVGYGDGTAWMANVFRGSPLGEKISAVSFYTYSPGTSYTVKIYDKCPTSGSWGKDVVNPVGGTLLVSESGTFGTAGYNTHYLKTPVTVSLGTYNFSVVVEVTDPTGFAYPIAIQNNSGHLELHPPYNGPTPRSHTVMGHSYISHNGVSWEDLYDSTNESVACLKAFGTK